MKKLLLVALAAFAALPAQAYYGRSSTEAILNFRATADVKLAGNPTVETLRDEGSAAHRNALARIDEQVQHLMGTFQSESFLKAFPYPGVLGEKYDVKFLTIADGSAKGRKLLGYEFSGRVVFKTAAFRNTDVRNDVPIKLPLQPDKIYKLGVKNKKNRCTDHHYNSEGDFWYFWDPDMADCPLPVEHP